VPSAATRARFRDLHHGPGLFAMPNAWDVGSARLLAHLGFEALATTSQGFAWSIGKRDQQVTRGELVAHVAQLAAATPLPLSVDSERCYPDDPGGVAETVRLLAQAGAAGCSVEDYDPTAGAVEPLGVALTRVAAVVEAAHGVDPPLVVTARAENHLYGGDDLDDTIVRLVAYRDAGADCVYAPGLTDADPIARVVRETGIAVNVLALPGAPSLPALEALGVRRVSTGSLLTSAAYGALTRAARELRGPGSSSYALDGLPADDRDAFSRA
jgi:2-methylisocitrate lyase-like PEP mutase family enzyme